MAHWWEANLQMLDAMGVWEDEIQPKLDTANCCHRHRDQAKWTWCEHCPKSNKQIALQAVMVITEDIEGLLKLETPNA